MECLPFGLLGPGWLRELLCPAHSKGILMSLGHGCLRLGGSTEIHQASFGACSLKYPSIVTDNDDSAKLNLLR